MATSFYEPREPADRSFARSALSFTFAVCGGLCAVYIFFGLMGAFDIGDAVALSIVCAILGLVWIAGFTYRLMTHATRTQWRDRERRGF